MRPGTKGSMIRLAAALSCLVTVACGERAACAQSSSRSGDHPIPPSLRKQLKEANERFTFRDKPINPLAVHDLLPWLSDKLPGPVAIDVAGTYGSNRYSGPYTTAKDGTVSVDLKEPGRSSAGGAAYAGYFKYRHLGMLANGIQVLRTWENAGGSGLFNSLLLVRFVVDDEYTGDGSRRYRLVLWQVGEYTLGDRYGGAIELQARANSIRIGADGKNVKKPRVWHLE
jgi:hypothetical protein